jgi:hypothetical protein
MILDLSENRPILTHDNIRETDVGAPDISKKEILYQPFTHISG